MSRLNNYSKIRHGTLSDILAPCLDAHVAEVPDDPGNDFDQLQRQRVCSIFHWFRHASSHLLFPPFNARTAAYALLVAGSAARRWGSWQGAAGSVPPLQRASTRWHAPLKPASTQLSCCPLPAYLLAVSKQLSGRILWLNRPCGSTAAV